MQIAQTPSTDNLPIGVRESTRIAADFAIDR